MKEEITKNRELSDDDVKQMLGGLNRVETPADFGMRVKARIAGSKAAEGRSRWGFLLPRLAVPAVFAVLAIGAFVVYFDRSGGTEVADVVPVTNEIAVTIPEKEDVAAQNNFEQPENDIIIAAAEPERTEPVAVAETRPQIRPQAVRTVRNAAEAREQTAPGSVDMMVRGPEEVIDIRSIRRAASVPVSAFDALKNAGITATAKDGFWEVASVSPQSPAARSGLQAGDRIESIDGRKPESSPVFSSERGIRALVVRNADGGFRVVNLSN